MTRTKDYIPNNNGSFYDFQVNLETEVTANLAAWNIPAVEGANLTTWSTDYQPLYKAIVNKKTRSIEQLIDHDAYRAKYVSFLRVFCQSFLTNNMVIPIGERVALGLNPRGLNPPSQRPDITTSPIVSLIPMGGGMVRFTFKVEASSTRYARQADSNGVEVFWKIAPQEKQAVLNDVLIEEEVTTKEATKLDGYQTFINTRAMFAKQYELDNVGQTIQVYARWVNTSDATKNGPYSGLSTMVIS
jgi:hypothetical protein